MACKFRSIDQTGTKFGTNERYTRERMFQGVKVPPIRGNESSIIPEQHPVVRQSTKQTNKTNQMSYKTKRILLMR